MKRSLTAAAAALLIAAAPAPEAPVQDAPLESAEEEGRARALFAEIRCVVCQNESIESSQAEIASDLRRVVREQVAAGRSDGEIRAYLVARYGEFVMFRPAFSPGNAVLWLAPFLLVLGGAGVLIVRGRRAGAAAPLTPEEAARLDAIETTEPKAPAVI